MKCKLYEGRNFICFVYLYIPRAYNIVFDLTENFFTEEKKERASTHQETRYFITSEMVSEMYVKNCTVLTEFKITLLKYRNEMPFKLFKIEFLSYNLTL